VETRNGYHKNDESHIDLKAIHQEPHHNQHPNSSPLDKGPQHNELEQEGHDPPSGCEHFITSLVQKMDDYYVKTRLSLIFNSQKI
jgi:hypothetical protein